MLDRYGTNVISWADPETAEVTAQLEVGTGFESNPQDYLEVGDGIAFVTRSASTSTPASKISMAATTCWSSICRTPKQPKILESIALPDDDDLPARPGRMIRVGDEVIGDPLERLSARLRHHRATPCSWACPSASGRWP